GFAIMAEASAKYKWNLNLSEVARTWTNGCIIKSQLMEELVEVLEQHKNTFDSDEILSNITNKEEALKGVLQTGMELRVALPSFSNAYNYWLGMTTANSPANIIQAQRDAFGAHSYKRTDRPFDQDFTTNWTQNG
ncbi:MAG: NADP-dependent phosphogluconate dehydrogenase, partial [Flavobacteriaceae bacterium]|nr:NADP-dependent phosphogluconate dehydrogenase [Flavobacteriaceae bacterium]